MSPPSRLVFDFAGVLFRWRPLVLLQQVLPQRAHDAASAMRLAAAIFQGYEGDWADFDRGRVDPGGRAGLVGVAMGASHHVLDQHDRAVDQQAEVECTE